MPCEAPIFPPPGIHVDQVAQPTHNNIFAMPLALTTSTSIGAAAPNLHPMPIAPVPALPKFGGSPDQATHPGSSSTAVGHHQQQNNMLPQQVLQQLEAQAATTTAMQQTLQQLIGQMQTVAQVA